MRRVSGLGGVFFKARNPAALLAWYTRHLGLRPARGVVRFRWRESERPSREGVTVWALFPATTEYFAPSRSSFMINYRVEDLDVLLATLRSEGIWVDERRENSKFGRFAWVMDPEGNRIELWEPPPKRRRSRSPGRRRRT